MSPIRKQSCRSSKNLTLTKAQGSSKLAGTLSLFSKSTSAPSNTFMEPVNPFVLNIPTYLDIIKRAMDIITLSPNVAKGPYSTIPPIKGNNRHSAVARFLNGPFFLNDTVLIYSTMQSLSSQLTIGFTTLQRTFVRHW